MRRRRADVDDAPRSLARQQRAAPLPERDVAKRTRSLSALFEGASAVGPLHWSARSERKRAERWIIDVLRDVRSGRLHPLADTAVHAVAWHKDADGKKLDARVAAVELLNVLRPTVAVSVYIALAAHALHAHPEELERVRDPEHPQVRAAS